MLVLVNAFKKLGGDVKDLTGHEEVCGRMLKEWCPVQPVPGRAVSEVIQFEAYLGVNKRRVEVERELTGVSDLRDARPGGTPRSMVKGPAC